MTEMPLVLVVEDDVWLGRRFEKVLMQANFRVRLTTNALAAIDLIDELHPDVLVLDMLLGGSTGLALLHELQSYADTGSIPVVLCTNLTATLNIRDVEPYGVRRILDKATMHPSDLPAAIRSVLL